MAHEELGRVRAYFSQFDRTTYVQGQVHTEDDIREFMRGIERRIKLLALIKGHVIVPASHLLESELAREFLHGNQEAVERGVLVAAIREDAPSLADFLAEKRASHEAELYADPDVAEVDGFLDANCAFVRWKPEATREFFIDRLLADLTHASGVLAQRLTPEAAAQIAREVEARQVSARQTIISAARAAVGDALWRGQVAEPFCEYLDFLYYLAGAVVVGAEGVLPQDNLIRYDLASSERRRRRLSDYEVFFRIFMNLVQAHTQTRLDTAVLDGLTVAEVAAMRGTADHATFVLKYEGLTRRAKEATPHGDVEGFLLNLQELEHLEWELHRSFGSSLAVEAEERARVRAREQQGAFVASVAALLPVYGTVDDLRQVVANGLAAFGGGRMTERLRRWTERSLDRMNRFVDTRPASERDLLLEFLAQVARRYIEKLPR